MDGDGNDGNISDFSAVCLDTLSKSLDPSEVLQVCMSAAWSLVSQVMGQCVCVCVSDGLFVSLFVCLLVCLFFCLFVCLSVFRVF